MMLSILAAVLASAQPEVTPVPPRQGPTSGTFNCEVRGADGKLTQFHGELGIAAPSEPGTLRGRVRISADGYPALNGIYAAERNGSLFKLIDVTSMAVFIYFVDGVRGGAVIVRQFTDKPDPGEIWLAGLCSHSLSKAPGRVIQ